MYYSGGSRGAVANSATASVESPTFLSYAPSGSHPAREYMRIINELPGINNDISITAWIYEGCAIRMGLDALINETE